MPDHFASDASSQTLDMRSHLKSLLDEKERQLEHAGTLGQRILAQQTEIEERVRELGDLGMDKSDVEVNPAAKSKYDELIGVMKAWDEENAQLANILQRTKNASIASSPLPSQSVQSAMPATANQRSQTAPPTSMLSRLTTSSLRAKKAVHRADDVGNGLLTEVRRLQSLLGEQDKEIQDVKDEKGALEKTVESLRIAIREQGLHMDKFKEENWNLEVTIQELRHQLSDALETVTALQNSRPRKLRDAALQTIPRQGNNLAPSPLPLLLSMLRDKRAVPVNSLANAVTVDLLVEFLGLKNYINLGLQIVDLEDIEKLLDFLVHLLHNNILSAVIPDANRRARRLMLKLLTRTVIIPKSLYLPNVSMEIPDYVARGGFANIFVGNYNGARVALKRLHNVRDDVNFCREAMIWRSLSHHYVLPFFGIHEDVSESFISLVSPFMENGTLIQWRKKVNSSMVDVEKRILEVAEGVQYLHAEGVVHGDLRGNNILLDSNFRVQIADFGLTRHSDATATKTLALSPNFSAPELLSMFDETDDDVADEDTETMLRTEKTDVFAFGSLYYEIHFGIVPFHGMSEITIIRNVRNKKRAQRLQHPLIEDDAWRLIHRCWKSEATRRPTMEDVAEIMLSWRSVS
ncbi:hypothetical protein AX17_005156 [Amanita inopinata Kibby_2008]|nr:hypothetical protein AX17_005156 [Amanita inopinata Kibby_2008]